MRHVILLLSVICLLWSTDVLAAKASPRIKELQESLTELGYSPGPADGFMGPDTQKAIVAFQKDHGLHIDGKYSGFLLLKVEVQREIARQEATPEGQRKKKERERLQAMTRDELISELERASNKETEKILNLLGKRNLELPARLLFGKAKLPNAALAFMVGLSLKGLYYPDSPEGVKEFQSDIGGSPTGELTLGQLEELTRRWSRFRETSVYVAGFGEMKIFVVGGYAIVEGTWILENEDIAYPVNRSKITCNREQRECLVVQAEVLVPAIDSKDDSYQLEVGSNTYSIVSWNVNEIVARDSDRCRITLLTLNINSNEVYEVTRNNETKECREGYLTLPKLDKPRIARLVPGWNQVYAFWKKRRDMVGKYANPRYRKEFEGAIKEFGGKK